MRLTGTVRPDRPLLVVAVPEEAAHLDTAYPVLLTGVGKVQASITVSGLLSGGERPSEIINLGTAGALRPGLAGTHEISRVIQHDFNTEALRMVTGHTFGLPFELAGTGPVLATGDVFVSDPTLRAELAAQADLVDMEGYAVAAAAHAYGVPVRIVKHVSDEADGAATTTWGATVQECARSLAEWLSAWRQ